MRVVVSGASGFIGSRLAKRLTELDHQVWAIVRPNSKLEELDQYAPTVSKITYHGQTQDLIDAFTQIKPDAVVHLASCFIAEHNEKDIDRLIVSNIKFGTDVLEAMQRTQTQHLVNTGTCWQHYHDQEYLPVNLYAATKEAFAKIVDYYADIKAVKCIHLKIFDTFGPADPRRKILNVFLSSLRQPADAKPLDLSEGKQRINFVHVDDICQAFVVALNRLVGGEKADFLPESYVLRSDQDFDLRELAHTIEQIADRPLPVRFGSQPYRKREVMTPYQGGQRLPGWTPTISLSDGLTPMVHDALNV